MSPADRIQSQEGQDLGYVTNGSQVVRTGSFMAIDSVHPVYLHVLALLVEWKLIPIQYLFAVAYSVSCSCA